MSDDVDATLAKLREANAKMAELTAKLNSGQYSMQQALDDAIQLRNDLQAIKLDDRLTAMKDILITVYDELVSNLRFARDEKLVYKPAPVKTLH